MRHHVILSYTKTLYTLCDDMILLRCLANHHFKAYAQLHPFCQHGSIMIDSCVGVVNLTCLTFWG